MQRRRSRAQTEISASCATVPRHSEKPAGLLPLRLLAAVAALLPALVAAQPAGAASAPALLAPPAVTGVPSEGGRLFASRGSWSAATSLGYSYSWYRCDTMGRHCRALAGATGRGHSASAADVGHTLTVAVRATDAGGSTRVFAGLVGPIASSRPRLESLTQPQVSGTATPGAAIRVDTGRWRPQPSSFEYQWARCGGELRECAPIAGATGATYTVAGSDLGHALVAIVQARSGAAARAVFSTATSLVVPAGAPAAPLSTSPPAVAEVLREGSILTGSIGAWSAAGPVAYAYGWYRCDASGAHCKAIHGATTLTHALGLADVGHTLGFAVRATVTTGTTTAYAPLVGPVAAADAALVSTAQPTIGGAAVAGQTLQVAGGGWSQAPTALGYQWQRCNANGRLCTPIAGATASSYATTADDAGHRLLVLVHATAGSAAQDALSDATAVVSTPLGPSLSVAPAVTGTIEQGAQLTGSNGTWSGAGTIAYAYNWYRCDASGAHCLSIHGATGPTYTEVAADVGHTLGFAVHATDGSGTGAAYAALVGPVAAVRAALVSTAQPAITGTAAAGRTLQVSPGSWSRPPTALGYQWQRCNPNGRVCTPIAGATASTYAVTADDSGHTLLAAVTGSIDGGSAGPAVSNHTAPVP